MPTAVKYVLADFCNAPSVRLYGGAIEITVVFVFVWRTALSNKKHITK